jgi:hypothetical protein
MSPAGPSVFFCTSTVLYYCVCSFSQPNTRAGLTNPVVAHKPLFLASRVVAPKQNTKHVCHFSFDKNRLSRSSALDVTMMYPGNQDTYIQAQQAVDGCSRSAKKRRKYIGISHDNHFSWKNLLIRSVICWFERIASSCLPAMRTEHRQHSPAHDSAVLIGIHEGRPSSRRKSFIRSTARSLTVVLFFVYLFGTFLVQHRISGIFADELRSRTIDFDSAPLRIKINMLPKSGQINTLDRLDESVPMRAENYQGEPSRKTAKGQSLPKQAERPRRSTLRESAKTLAHFESLHGRKGSLRVTLKTLAHDGPVLLQAENGPKESAREPAQLSNRNPKELSQDRPTLKTTTNHTSTPGLAKAVSPMAPTFASTKNQTTEHSIRRLTVSNITSDGNNTGFTRIVDAQTTGTVSGYRQSENLPQWMKGGSF